MRTDIVGFDRSGPKTRGFESTKIDKWLCMNVKELAESEWVTKCDFWANLYQGFIFTKNVTCGHFLVNKLRTISYSGALEISTPSAFVK